MKTIKNLILDIQDMSTSAMHVLQTYAAFFGIAGALLLAVNTHPALGFGAFFASSLGWMLFSVYMDAWRMFAQHVCFLITSLIGLWNWWLGPLLIGGAV